MHPVSLSSDGAQSGVYDTGYHNNYVFSKTSARFDMMSKVMKQRFIIMAKWMPKCVGFLQRIDVFVLCGSGCHQTVRTGS